MITCFVDGTPVPPDYLDRLARLSAGVEDFTEQDEVDQLRFNELTNRYEPKDVDSMKKITLTSDEWQSIIEAIHFAVAHHKERIAHYRTKGDELSARALERQKSRYLHARDRIIDERADKGE